MLLSDEWYEISSDLVYVSTSWLLKIIIYNFEPDIGRLLVFQKWPETQPKAVHGSATLRRVPVYSILYGYIYLTLTYCIQLLSISLLREGLFFLL